ncbi:MAG: nucleotidyltransferase domain-containing protein [Eubacteriales bacterium]|nr:nucleotidyltransferase domain-containing protein [Eubacteriales bacterium]
MYQHHIDSIEKMKEYYAGMEGLIALVLGGSVAKGNERPDSDLDGMLIVTDEVFEQRRAAGKTAECVRGECTYPEGYFDMKYMTKDYIKAAASHASEPTRNSFIGARVLLSRDPEIDELVPKIGLFQTQEREDKMISFYGDYLLNHNYFIRACKVDGYMRVHAVGEILYSIYRMILQENEILFPCNRRLEETVAKAPLKPERIIELGRAAAEKMDDDSIEAFANAYFGWTKYPLPQDKSIPHSRYVTDYEQWWYTPRPLVNEW